MICHSSYHYVQQRSTLSLFFPQCRGRSLCISLQARDGFFVFDHMDNKTNSSSVTQREPSDPVTIKQTSVMTDTASSMNQLANCARNQSIYFSILILKNFCCFFFVFSFLHKISIKLKFIQENSYSQ